ncbi:MAG: FadR family transcriptional regulator [Burkholderiales bacterium]|nr:FadR family transcriptional regulator [Burkholderiales bacterium]MDE2455956.1 FadR family transcriptional regulator [Burkholderiales bacterium]
MARVKPTRFEFLPVQLVRPCETVAYRITEAIGAGDVKVGERLPSEKDLSSQLGVSRPTLREAVKLLVGAGIVQVVAGSSGGTFVTSDAIPPQLAGPPLPELPAPDIESVLEARRLFEPHLARLAATYATPADFERMRSAVALSESVSNRFRGRKLSADAAHRMTLASTRFNMAIARATHNAVILKMMEIMLRRMEPVRLAAVRHLADPAISTRTLVNSLAAIESGDPQLIDRATAERIGQLEAAWENAIGKPLRRRPLLQAAGGGEAGVASPAPPGGPR